MLKTPKLSNEVVFTRKWACACGQPMHEYEKGVIKNNIHFCSIICADQYIKIRAEDIVLKRDNHL